MITLAIVSNRPAATFQLVSAQPVGYGFERLTLLETFVPFGSFSTRPDPIQRSWQHLEVKWGMAGKQEPPAPLRPCTPVKPKGLLGWVRSLGTPQVDPGASCEVQR